MAVFEPSEDKRTGKIVGACKICGGECRPVSDALWDAPGDCAPTIDSWRYCIACDKCGTRNGFQKTIELAIGNAHFIRAVVNTSND